MHHTTWPFLECALSVAIPISFAFAMLLASPRRPFQTAVVAAYVGSALALLVTAACAVTPDQLPTTSTLIGALAATPRIDIVTSGMMLLICFIAVVIVRYSRTYLRGDPGQLRYARALNATLTTVTVLVLANNLIVISLAWMGTSLALHQLLTFYSERPQALVAAHKKFILSRLADGCVLGAIVLLRRSGRDLSLDGLNRLATEGAPFPHSVQGAAVLLVVAVCLKSAQLPFHGWLIQVMEAPTPVSALLHAGVVNIGGFVVIRLAPFFSSVPAAQLLLLTVGASTAIVGSLVMMTRVSVKVTLAWSTCAQMGFMLLECGLGAWNLALLHLFAHSLYKAHAFLRAGTALDIWRIEAISPVVRPPRLTEALLVSLFTVVIVGAVARGAGVLSGDVLIPSASLTPLGVILGLSLAPFAIRAVSGRGVAVVGILLRAAGVALLYVAAHALAASVFRLRESEPPFGHWLIAVAALSIVLCVQVILECRPGAPVARWLQSRLFAGLYLDEIFTRLAFSIWPPPLARRQETMVMLRTAPAREVP